MKFVHSGGDTAVYSWRALDDLGRGKLLLIDEDGEDVTAEVLRFIEPTIDAVLAVASAAK